MSEKLPVISGKDVVKALNKVGYEVVRQKGSEGSQTLNGETSLSILH